MILLRHPRPEVAEGVCYGRLDLSAGFNDEVVATLAEVAPSGVVSSPARRCILMAEAIAKAADTTLSIDPRWQELDFGAWEGRRWDMIDRAESDPWAADPWSSTPPGGETFAALHARVGAALDDAPAGGLVVTHAGPIRAARMILLGESFETVFAAPVPYATPIRLLREPA